MHYRFVLLLLFYCCFVSHSAAQTNSNTKSVKAGTETVGKNKTEEKKQKRFSRKTARAGNGQRYRLSLPFKKQPIVAKDGTINQTAKKEQQEQLTKTTARFGNRSRYSIPLVDRILGRNSTMPYVLQKRLVLIKRDPHFVIKGKNNTPVHPLRVGIFFEYVRKYNFKVKTRKPKRLKRKYSRGEAEIWNN